MDNKALKEDVVYSLKRLEAYILEMDDEQFEKVLNGEEVHTCFMAHDWKFYTALEPDLHRGIYRLRLRLF